MSDPSRVRVTGPLLAHVAGFRDELARQGYRSGSATTQLQLMAHVSRWLVDHGLQVSQLTPVEVERFIECRRSQGYAQHRSSHALVPLLRYLQESGAIAVPAVEAATPLEKLLERYREHLLGARGLAPSTTQRYLGAARAFLSEQAGQRGELDLAGLSASRGIDFVRDGCRRMTPASAKDLIVCLRSLLRFLAAAGIAPTELAEALPAVAVWGGGSLPRALPAEQVAALLASCDPASVIGRRDFAVLTMLSRLGLRAGEVAGLLLDDFDWRLGEVVVRGKGHQVDRMPLPVDVGEAVVAYLDGGRPRVACRSVFLRVNAPIVGLSAIGVSTMVGRACERTGMPWCGAHRLRHSAATSMLRAGGSLTEVGQVLRHRSGPATTGIYAKVDWQALASVTQPWPAGGGA